jgi:hypothetical protein
VRSVTACAAIILGSCASPGLPPGGPPDAAAPRLLGVAPESGRVGISPRAVVFSFDEVVAERPAGVPSLADLFTISPQNGTPEVDWDRSEVAVRPREGWRRNTIYTVLLQPGMADLRGNVSRAGASTVFSTGGPIPQTRVVGRAFDWAAGAAAGGSLVQAVTPDSVIYVTLADTTGRFVFAHLPPGSYSLRAVLDENRNRALDPTEKFDTATVTLTESASVELFAYVRDSVPPRLSEITVTDSLTLRLAFDLALDPTQTFSASQFAVIGADSVPLPLMNASPGPPDTTLRLTRAIPPRAIILTLARPLVANATYRVVATGIRGLGGAIGRSERTVRAAPGTPPRQPTI